MQADPNDVLAFTGVVQAGSFTAAAQLLGLPKSTVSRRVSRLEDRLGVRLLQRTTRKLSLTDSGRAYYDLSVRALSDLDAAEQAVSKMQTAPRGLLRFTAPVEIGPSLGVLLPEFLADYPEVELEADFTNRYVDLVEEGYDLAVRAGSLPDSTLIARKLRASERCLVASPEYLGQHGAPHTIAEIKDHSCVIFQSFLSGGHWRLRSAEGSTSVLVHGALKSNSFDAVRAGACAGLGIAQLPREVVNSDLEAGTLVEVLPDVWPPAGALWLVYPSTRHLAPKTRAFVTWLEQRLPDLEGSTANSLSPPPARNVR